MGLKSKAAWTAPLALSLWLAALPVDAEAGFADQILFGAISYSDGTRVYGLARNFANERDAVIRALNDCEGRAKTGDCRILVTFRNGCGALAESPEGAYGSGWGVNRERARHFAADVCMDGGGESCKITKVVCSGVR